MGANASREIFFRPWHVTIPEIYCVSDIELELFGTPTSGNKRLDAALRDQPRYMYLTIAGLATYHDEGAPITLQRPTDAVDIYRIIQEHMADWQWIAKNTLNGRLPPQQDLMILDEFAASVFPISRAFNNAVTPTFGLLHSLSIISGRSSPFTKRFSQLSRRSASSYSGAETETTNVELDPDTERHRSFLPSILEYYR